MSFIQNKCNMGNKRKKSPSTNLNKKICIENKNSIDQPQVQLQNSQQPLQDMPLHNNLSTQSQSVQSPIPTSLSTQITQFSEVKSPIVLDNQNIEVKVEEVETVEQLKDEKKEVKWPLKRKINKKEQKKRLNARMRRLVCPKSPLMVFSELYKDVPIKLEEQVHNNYTLFIASIEIDGKIYTGDHVSKTQAKQKACENLLRVMLKTKMSERSEKKEENFTENDMEINDNGTSVKPKGPPQEDFPWQHFASLAMHNLIAHWELQPVTRVIQEETVVKITSKTGGMKKFPDNPSIYNPIQLLHQMTPGIKFNEIIINHNNPSLFEVSCEMNDVRFSGQGSTKKAAKKECAIAAIKYFWKFDYNATEEK